MGAAVEIGKVVRGGWRGWCVVDGSLSRWLMGLIVIGLGWRFVDGLFVGLARFGFGLVLLWISAVVAVSCDCGGFWQFFVFLFLLVVVSCGCCWW